MADWPTWVISGAGLLIAGGAAVGTWQQRKTAERTGKAVDDLAKSNQDQASELARVGAVAERAYRASNQATLRLVQIETADVSLVPGGLSVGQEIVCRVRNLGPAVARVVIAESVTIGSVTYAGSSSVRVSALGPGEEEAFRFSAGGTVSPFRRPVRSGRLAVAYKDSTGSRAETIAWP